MNSMNGRNTGVLVIDDDASVRESLSTLIRSTGRNVKTYASAQDFLASSRSEVPGCMVLDVQLPGLSGLDLQQELAKTQPDLPIIFITGHGDIPMTVRAMKAGAIEFLTKPFRDEDLLQAIEQALNRGRQFQPWHDKSADEDPLSDNRHRGGHIRCSEIVGESADLRQVWKAIETVAPTDSTVLIHGESGTGKELIARAVHELSARQHRPFVKLNCAAIPTGLLESELFGHEKGAFTGAIATKIGRFELADRGTLFLDEIGDIPLELQPKLLRVLQDQEFERVGSTRSVRVNVRIVAATHRDLKRMVTKMQFRDDLYYRLHVFPVHLPPLRERREDIPLLVQHFVRKCGAKLGKRIDVIPSDTMRALVEYDWPGNVRELENLLERALILSETELRIPDSDLRHWSGQETSSGSVLEQSERGHILRAVKESGWVIGGPNGAAAKLGLKRTTLQYKIQKYAIARQIFTA
jgi:DNA-binding NtrC family response regulator